MRFVSGLAVLLGVLSLAGCPADTTPSDAAGTDGGAIDAPTPDAYRQDAGIDATAIDAFVDLDGSADVGNDAASEPCTTAGAIEHLPCGFCGTLDRFCTSAHEWAYGACTNDHGVCSPGDTSTGPCGRCGQQTLFCETTCTWTPMGSCVGETGTCTPGTTTRVSDGCPTNQTRVRTCTATCGTTDGPCQAVECTPAATMSVPCGMCGTQLRTCDASGHWVDGMCTGEGVCMPGATMSRTCQVCGTQPSTCSDTCQWVGGACTGGVTCTTPSAVCLDATRLRTYPMPATCVAGACSFAPMDVTCTAGCSGIGCIGGATLLNGLGGTTGYGPDANTVVLTDDGSSPSISLAAAAPTGLHYYTGTYTTVFVNNNGNVSFGALLMSYVTTLPGATVPMIAPFWGDVDTRGAMRPAHGNVVWFADTTRFVATWDHVGYFNMRSDRENSFQLILTVRPDRAAGDFDVEFRYAQCQWTTGDTSTTPATAGFDGADGTHFLTLPGSGTTTVLDLCTTSNVGIAGVWRFEVRNGTPTAP
jgi:hypothetical protein